MRRFFSIALLFVVAFSLIGCQEKATGVDWGETKFYESSFLRTYEPVVMSRTLNFSLNEGAADMCDREFAFEVQEKLPTGNMEKANGIVVYKNNEKCADNILRVKGNEGKVVLGIEFTEAVEEGNHHYFLVAKSLNGLDNIQYISLEEGFIAKKRDIMNPANKWLMLISMALVAIYLLWLILLRPMLYPHVKFSRVYVTYPDCTDDVAIRVNNCCEVIFTNKPIKQNFLHTMFMVRSLVIVNECWTSPVKLCPAKHPFVRVVTRLSIDHSPLDRPERKETFYVYNDNNQKIGIHTT